MFIPRNVEHAWTAIDGPARVINTCQPAGRMEEFFQALSTFKGSPKREQVTAKSYTADQINELKQVFKAHGMIVTGPPIGLE